MIRFIAVRLASAFALALAVSFASFALIFSNGASIARTILGVDASEEAVAAKAVELGLDRPVIAQYIEWLFGAIQGDLGRSYYSGELVADVIAARAPVTLSLVGLAMLVTAVLSVLLGIASAVATGWLDRVLQFVALIGSAVPSFVVALALILTMAVGLRLVPSSGYTRFDADPGGWLVGLVLPVSAVAIGAIGAAAQQFRGAVKDVLEQDYVRTLRSRGIRPWAVVFRHVFRNAAGPGIIILGLQIILLMGGVVVIERIFALPGIGNTTVGSSLQGDIPIVMGCILFIIIVVVVVNLVTDLINAALNPKAATR